MRYSELDTIPFRCELSFDKAIQYLKENRSQLTYAEGLIHLFDQKPHLHGVIRDSSILDQEKDFISQVATLLFPLNFWQQQPVALTQPFHLNSVFMSPQFEKIILEHELEFFSLLPENEMKHVKVLNSYLCIAKYYYGMDIETLSILPISLKNTGTGLIRHFDLRVDFSYVEVIAPEGAPLLSPETRQLLLSRADNLSLWQQYIPSDRFIFKGISILHVQEVTESRLISLIQNQLLESDSVFSEEGFSGLTGRMRDYLRLPDVSMGLAAIDGSNIIILNNTNDTKTVSCVTECSFAPVSDYLNTVFFLAIDQKSPVIIDDLSQLTNRTKVEESLLRAGVKSLYVAPLFHNANLVGTLQLWTPNPGELTALRVMKLRPILPIFALTAKRSLEDMNNKIQAVIREKYTAIHPSVAWRFRHAAIKYIQKARSGKEVLPEPIEFKDVYPLYAISDIRGSSEKRNAAIQADLINQMELAMGVIKAAYRTNPLPFLDHLVFRIEKALYSLNDGIHTGDEAQCLDLLRNEIEPVFHQLATFDDEVKTLIEHYRNSLDPVHGVIYKKRKAFDESVQRLNQSISRYIETEEEKAQHMFPHYFEKHSTDGVDFGLYAGASLVEDGKFNTLHLKNLRLWKLLVLCGAARIADGMKYQIPELLEMTHLVLVQNMPLSIQYMLDDKQFDVEGAYNIRYEILKKRIDKAVVRSTHERLTQPNTISIVFSQPREGAEYKEYIEYLQARGYLDREIQEFELEDLQGVKGLRAFRIKVLSGPADEDFRIDHAELEIAMSELVNAKVMHSPLSVNV